MYVATGENITGQFNISDNFMIHSFNFSLDGTEIHSAWDLNDTLYVYNFSQSPANLSVGNHTLSVRFADGHTASNLREDYDWRNGLFNDYLKFNFPEGGYAQIIAKEDSWWDDWDAIREKDRYKFDFQPATPSATQNFVVTSDSPIIIKEKAGYYNDRWLIMGDHWMDFVVDNEPNAKVSFKRIDDFNIDVTIDGLKNPERQIYSSIGDLNVVTQNYTFFITNATNTYSSAVQIYEQQTITLNINTSALILQTNASLNWNGSSRSSTKTSYSNYDSYVATFVTPNVINSLTENITFFWNYTINGTVNNFSGSVKENQTLYRIGIDNCSTYTAMAVNITTQDASNDTYINSNINMHLTAWIDLIQNSTSFNLSWTGGHARYGICIYPNSSAYNITAQMIYSATDTGLGYESKTYYLTNTSLNNVTDYLQLYFEVGTTPVTFSVLDENDDTVSNVKIKVLRYDVGTDSYVTTEILNTDSDGQAIGQIVLNTQQYMFILELDGKIVFESDPTILTTTTKTFRIHLGTDVFSDYTTAKDTTGDVSWDNATLTFTFIYSDASGGVNDGCLKVIRRTANSAIGDVVLSDACTTSSAAVLTYTIVEAVQTHTYVAVGSVLIDGEEFVLDTETVSFDIVFKTWGLEGVMMVFLLVLTFAMIGVSSTSPQVAVFLMMIGFVGSVAMKLFGLGWIPLIVFMILGGVVLYRISRQ